MDNRTHVFPNGTVGGANKTLANFPQYCTLETCDLTLASFLYVPTLPGNALYAAIFGVLIIGQLFLGIKHKTWGYMIAMLLGLVSTTVSPQKIQMLTSLDS